MIEGSRRPKNIGTDPTDPDPQHWCQGLTINILSSDWTYLTRLKVQARYRYIQSLYGNLDFSGFGLKRESKLHVGREI
jgi:hypothetical protein